MFSRRRPVSCRVSERVHESTRSSWKSAERHLLYLALVPSRRLPPSFAKQPCPCSNRPGVLLSIEITNGGAARSTKVLLESTSPVCSASAADRVRLLILTSFTSRAEPRWRARSSLEFSEAFPCRCRMSRNRAFRRWRQGEVAVEIINVAVTTAFVETGPVVDERRRPRIASARSPRSARCCSRDRVRDPRRGLDEFSIHEDRICLTRIACVHLRRARRNRPPMRKNDRATEKALTTRASDSRRRFARASRSCDRGTEKGAC
jgi:hypothetical protein